MTRRCVDDEQYGQLSRRVDELKRRVDEKALDFDVNMQLLQQMIEGQLEVMGPRPNHRLIAVGQMFGNEVYLTDFTACNNFRLIGHSDLDDVRVCQVALSPDGSLIASGDSNGLVRLSSTRSWRKVFEFQVHESGVSSLAFCHPYGNLLAIGDNYGNVYVFNLVNKGEQAYKFEELQSHAKVAYSPDGKLLAAADRNNVYVWDRKGKLVRTFHDVRDGVSGQLSAVFFSPDSKMLGVSGCDFIRIWETKSWSRCHNFRHGYGDCVEAVAFSADSRFFAYGFFDRAEIVDLDDEEDSRYLQYGPDSTRDNQKGSYALNSLAFTPDGKTLAASYGEEGICLWNWREEHLIGEIKRKNQVPMSVHFLDA